MAYTSNAEGSSIYDDPVAGAVDAESALYEPYGNNNPLYGDNQSLQIPQGGDPNNAEGGNVAEAYGAYNEGSYDSMPQQSSSNKDEGKLFVGGLSWETDEDKLRSYFSKYGNILDCTIMRDPATNRPRGFGFVTFDSVNGVNAVLQEPTHTLDNKQIDPKHAIPRDGHASGGRSNNNNNNNTQFANGGNQGYNNHNNNYASNKSGGHSSVDPVKDMQGDKIFVGGLPPSAADADLNSGFAQFGNIVDTKLIMDKVTGRSRNFGFLQFDNDDSAMAAVRAGNTGGGIQIHGKRVDVRGARYSKQDPSMAGQGNAYNMMNMGNYGMMGMGMMGMQGYGMMPNYGMMGANGANGNMDYMSAMNYGGYYGNMAGFYGGAQGDGTGNDGGANGDGTNNGDGSSGYYGQMNMPSNGYYGAGGLDSGDVQGDGSGAGGNLGGKSGDHSGSGNYDKQQGGNGGYSRGSRRHGDDRGKSDRGGRDSGHRSSNRYGGSKDAGNSSSRSGRDRQRTGEHSSSHGGHRSRDDYRNSRGSRTDRDRGRDRDGPVRGPQGSSTSRGHGYNPY
ncbi:hypothetical protein H4R99_001574 [Coemansia sp. RSA 1722]|nr:hypothetical protein H4R99_001574 [Coemansia sp. RSA 1722]KAJ2640195.1 hypothetical protein GGF40_000343 [Coemansia sp. RSA 1286]